MEAAMLYNISISQHWVTCSSTDNRETNFACIVEAGESTRRLLQGCRSSPKDHEDHIAGKGINSQNHQNLVHKFIALPKAMKTSGAKAAFGQILGKLPEL